MSGRNLTVAKVITNAALLEHMLISVSRPIIFLTLDTILVSIQKHREARALHGSWLEPVASLRGGIAVVLYGIVESRRKGFWCSWMGGYKDQYLRMELRSLQGSTEGRSSSIVLASA